MVLADDDESSWWDTIKSVGKEALSVAKIAAPLFLHQEPVNKYSEDNNKYSMDSVDPDYICSVIEPK
jgi:hypothetical protein